MGNRLTKIYTRTGDDGTTGMANGDRALKSDLPFVVMGEVDELNAHIGMIASQLSQSNLFAAKQPIILPLAQTTSTKNKETLPCVTLEDIFEHLSIVQHLLFNVGGEIAMPEYQGITDSHISWLETQIDALNQHLSPLKDFILPAGSILVSQIHIARTVCRRSERYAVELKIAQPDILSAPAFTLINRLSDWLFVLARYCAALEKHLVAQTEPSSTQSQPNPLYGEVLWNKTILEHVR